MLHPKPPQIDALVNKPDTLVHSGFAEDKVSLESLSLKPHPKAPPLTPGLRISLPRVLLVWSSR